MSGLQPAGKVRTAVIARTEPVRPGNSASLLAVMAGNSSTTEGPQSKNGQESRMSLRARETNSRKTPAAARGPIPEVRHSLGGSPNVQNKRLPSPNRCTRSVKFGTRSVKIGAGSVKTGTRNTSHYGLIVLSTITRLQDLRQAVGQSHSTFGRFYLRQLPIK